MRTITCRPRLLVIVVAALLTAIFAVFLHAAPQQKPATASRPGTSRDAVGSGLPFDLAQGRQAGTPRAEAAAKIPSIEEKTAHLQKLDGYFPLYWDQAAGTLWMEIPKLDTEVLYINGLSAGIGSNDIGLDRGQLGATRLVRFERIGPKVLMVQPNYRFRATSGNPDEERAVRESFATSVIWGFSVAAGTGGRVIVERLIALGATSPMPQVRAIASHRLQGLRSRFAQFHAAEEWPMEQLIAADITRFLERPAEPYKPVPIPSAPPGAPIGEPGYQWLPPYGTGTMWWEWWDGQN